MLRSRYARRGAQVQVLCFGLILQQSVFQNLELNTLNFSGYQIQIYKLQVNGIEKHATVNFIY